MSTADNDVGAACLLQNVTGRKFEDTTPFHRSRPMFSRIAKLGFDLREPPLDRRFSLVDQLLSLLAVCEIQRGAELRRGDSDDPRFESLGEFTSDLQPGVIWLIERQADHDGRVCHTIS